MDIDILDINLNNGVISVKVGVPTQNGSKEIKEVSFPKPSPMPNTKAGIRTLLRAALAPLLIKPIVDKSNLPIGETLTI